MLYKLPSFNCLYQKAHIVRPLQLQRLRSYVTKVIIHPSIFCLFLCFSCTYLYNFSVSLLCYPANVLVVWTHILHAAKKNIRLQLLSLSNVNVVCTKRTATTVLPYTGQWPPGREYSKRHVALLDVRWCYWPTNVFFFIRFPLMIDFFSKMYFLGQTEYKVMRLQ